MRAEVKINNMPRTMRGKYIVARRDERTARLWYYGNYDTEERALEVALEIRNGIVVELADEVTVKQYGDHCTMISNLGELNLNL